MGKRKINLPYRILSAFVAFTFVCNLIVPPQSSFAQLTPQTILNLPSPGSMVTLSAGFNPVLVRGITIHPDNPLRFDFIVDPGDENLAGEALTTESTKLIKYFLATLTTPEDEIWVNLSPYEKDRMIPERFGDTQMGRDLLAQDYLLKQLTASLMYPEKELGKEFWGKVYKEAYAKYGTTKIPVDTFNKVWIVPEKAVVYERESSAFVLESRLKVMLEQDYEASRYNQSDAESPAQLEDNAGARDEVQRMDAGSSMLDSRGSSSIETVVIKEVILPAIEKEVNEGRTFANLRQIYNSMILATWYKIRLKDSLLGQVYVDQGKTKGVDTEDKQINQKIYSQYLEAFKQGVYNYIKEDYDPSTQTVVPRKYFSGGFTSSSPVFGTLNKIVGAALIVANLGVTLPDIQAKVGVLNNPNFKRITWESKEIGENFDADYLRLAQNVKPVESTRTSSDLSLKETGKIFTGLAMFLNGDTPEEKIFEPDIHTAVAVIIAAGKDSEDHFSSSPVEGQERSIKKSLLLFTRRVTLVSLLLASTLTFTSDQNELTQYSWEEIREWIITDKDGEFARFYKDQLVGSEDLKKILERAKYENPRLVLSIIDFYEKEPYAAGLIESALRNDPQMAIEMFNSYRHMPKAKEWLKQSIFTVLKLNSFSGVKTILRNASYYKDEPYAGEAIEKAAAINKMAVMENAHNIGFLPNAEDILEKAALYVVGNTMHELMGGFIGFNENSIAAVINFLDRPYRDKLIAGMLKNHPEAFLQHSKGVLAFPDGREIIHKAAQELLNRSLGWRLFDHAELFLEEPNGILLIQQAAQTASLKQLVDYRNILARFPDQGEEILNKEVQEMAGNKYGALSFIREAHKLMDLPYLPAALDKAIEYAAEGYLDKAEQLNNLPGAKQRFKKAVFKSAEGLQMRIENSVWVLRHADKIKGEVYAQEAISLAATNDIHGAIQHFDKYEFLPNAVDILTKALEAAANSSETRFYARTEVLLENANRLRHIPGIEEYVRKAALNNPGAAMFAFSKYNQVPNAKEILKTAVLTGITRDKDLAGATILAAPQYIDQPYAQQIVRKAAAINPENAIEYFEFYQDLPQAIDIARESIRQLLKNDPGGIIRRFQDIRLIDQLDADEFLKEAILKEPSAFLNLRGGLVERNLIIDRLALKSNPLINVFLNIVNKDLGLTDAKTAKILALFNDIARHGLTVEEAEKIVDQPLQFLNRLLDIKNEPGHIGERAVENHLNDVSLRLVHRINELHNENDRVRFASVNNATPRQLYAMMVYGEEEVFTSTYNGLFNRLIERMRQENTSGDKLLKDAKYNRFRTFIKLGSSYNRLIEFFDTLPKDALNDLLERFILGIDQEENILKEAVITADTLSTVKDENLRNLFLRLIKQKYQGLEQREGKEQRIIYGLLANIISKNLEWLPNSQLYKLPDLTKISTERLFENGLHIQRYTFFDDEDGRASYLSFLSRYRKDKQWQIQEKESYVIVSSHRNGREIQIYANKPGKDFEGNEEIDALFTERNISPQFIIHRGHSYHVDQTMRYIDPKTLLVFLGSCGGYTNLSRVLELSPESLIISTKGTGTMHVNDPLLKMLNESILAEDTINWETFWSTAEARLGKLDDFRNYIAPHRNIGAMFIKAHRNLMHEQDIKTLRETSSPAGPDADFPSASSPVSGKFSAPQWLDDNLPENFAERRRSIFGEGINEWLRMNQRSQRSPHKIKETADSLLNDPNFLRAIENPASEIGIEVIKFAVSNNISLGTRKLSNFMPELRKKLPYLKKRIRTIYLSVDSYTALLTSLADPQVQSYLNSDKFFRTVADEDKLPDLLTKILAQGMELGTEHLGRIHSGLPVQLSARASKSDIKYMNVSLRVFHQIRDAIKNPAIQRYLESNEFQNLSKEDKFAELVFKIHETGLPLQNDNLVHIHSALPRRLSASVEKRHIPGVALPLRVFIQVRQAIANPRIQEYLNSKEFYEQTTREDKMGDLVERILQEGLPLESEHLGQIYTALPAKLSQYVSKKDIYSVPIPLEIFKQIRKAINNPRIQAYLKSPEFEQLDKEDKLGDLVDKIILEGLPLESESLAQIYSALPSHLTADGRVRKKDIQEINLQMKIFRQIRAALADPRIQAYMNSKEFYEQTTKEDKLYRLIMRIKEENLPLENENLLQIYSALPARLGNYVIKRRERYGTTPSVQVVHLSLKDFTELRRAIRDPEVQAYLESPAYRELFAEDKLVALVKKIKSSGFHLSNDNLGHIYSGLPANLTESGSVTKDDIQRIELPLRVYEQFRSAINNPAVQQYLESQDFQVLVQRGRIETLRALINFIKTAKLPLESDNIRILYDALPRQLSPHVIKENFVRPSSFVDMTGWVDYSISEIRKEVNKIVSNDAVLRDNEVIKKNVGIILKKIAEMASLREISPDAVENERLRRLATDGGFDQGIILEDQIRSKLVRDNIPAKMKAGGQTANFHNVTGLEKLAALVTKAEEELGYLQGVIAKAPEKDPGNIQFIHELAALKEVGIAINNVLASSPVGSLSQEVGGIDLNPALLDLQIKRDGNGVPLPLLQQPIGEMNIEGFFPIIINVAPATNLPLLLGLRDNPNQDSNESLSDISPSPMDRKEYFRVNDPEQAALN